MKLYGIGNALFYFREQKNLSQMQVCAGICSEMTISRIETGEREFDSMLSETLLERVGKTANRFEFVLNDEDYALYELREAIKRNVAETNIGAAKEYINRYKTIMPEQSVLHEQFVLYYEALIIEKENGDSEEILRLLHNAIDLTRPDYKDNSDQMILYSVMEINIIYHLFLYEDYTEEMLNPVMRFVREMYDEEEKGELLVPFYLLLAEKYEKEGKFFEMKKISEEAITMLQGGRSYLNLTNFHFKLVKAGYQLYKSSQDWSIYKQELVELCNAIYYMSMITEDEDMMGKVIQFCEENLECQITM